MRKLLLNDQPLNSLALLKRHQELAASEHNNKVNGWMKTLRDYYYGLSEALTADLGLMQKECGIRATEHLQSPTERLERKSDELNQFEFCY